MSEKIKAIVIRSNDRKEKDTNVLLFSVEKGKIWATLKGVKTQNAKMKLASQPFCFGEFIIEEGKTGNVVIGFECLESFHEISENIDRYFEASAVLEILDKLKFSNNFEQAQAFLLVLKTLKSLCFFSPKSIYAINKFMIGLFEILGVPLREDKCSCCGTTAFDKLYIDYSTGEFVCTGCKTYNNEEVQKTVLAALKILRNTDFEKLGTLKLAQGSEVLLLKLLVKNFERQFDEHLKLMGVLS